MHKRILYGTVSALALLMAAGTAANAQSTMTTTVDSNTAGAAKAPAVIDTQNTLENFSFENFAGALQVQQNASLNSAASQNLAIDTLKATNGGFSFFSAASSTDNVEGNSAPDASIDSHNPAGDNRIQDNAFSSAAGAVQVQQNRSINSAAGQNMDIDPVTVASLSGGAATAKLTNNVGDTTGNTMLAGQVAGNNSITGSAFANAGGAFQVQQSNGINSSTQQNASITPMTATIGGGFAVSVTSEADLDQNVSGNLALNAAVTGLNRIDAGAFQNAKGAFQVQQSNAVNSGVGQNLGVTSVDAVLGSSAQLANTANATSTVANNGAGWEINPPNTFDLTLGSANVDTRNLLDDLAFSAASGAFQVQQNGSIDSAVGQNMSVAAIKLSGAATAKTEAGNAVSTNNVENNAVFTSSVDFAGGDNTIRGLAFGSAAGAFQVQQNRSLNSATGQNMDMEALTDPGASITSQVNSTAKLTSNVGDKAQNDFIAAHVNGSNSATGAAFDAASGAFQVQQNNSSNSSTQQNMSITALNVAGGSVKSLGLGGEADLTGVAELSRTVFADIAGLNSIDSLAFANANGAFQVQQSTSADSAVGQNMAIAALDTSEGPAGGFITTTGTANLSSTVAGVTSGINHFSPVGTPPGGFWFFAGVTSLPVNVDVENRIDGLAFQNAHGAFQVQQNGSINGVVSQDLAITAATLNAVPTGNVLVNANSQTFVGFNSADSSNIDTFGADNVVDGFAFQSATGAFQVQQNRSINSAAGQNMAIAAINDPNALSFGPTNSTATVGQDILLNSLTNSNVAGTNSISGDSFGSAAGAFQAQQNNSVNSSTQQNMAIGAVDTNGAPAFGSSDEVANLGAVVSGNSLSNVTVAGLNTISGNAFQNAKGAFQVQQSTSANSAVSQNMSIVAISMK